MKKYFILIFALILCLIPVNAVISENFEYLGDEQNRLSFGYFNEYMTTDVLSVYGHNVKGYPLFTDLDRDGTREVVALDTSNQLYVYRGLDMDIISVLGVTCSNELVNIIVNDIDNNKSNKEIIVFCQDKISLINFDNDVLSLEREINTPSLQSGQNYDRYTAGMNCFESICVYDIIHGGMDTGSIRESHYINAFNRTNDFTETIHNLDGQYYILLEWHDENRKMNDFLSFDDVDGNGYMNFYRGMGLRKDVSGGLDGTFYIIYDYEFNGTDIYLKDENVLFEIGYEGREEIKFTDVYVSKLSNNVGLQFAFVSGYDDNNLNRVRLYLYDKNYNEIYSSSYFDVDGGLSNIVRMDAFESTEKNEFCVVVYNTDNFELICANKLDSLLINSNTFTGTYPDGITKVYTGTRLYAQPTYQIHDDDVSQIVLPFGIYTPVSSLLTDTLELVYPMPTNAFGHAQAIDMDGDRLSEIVHTTTSNIYVLDDGFVNSFGYINTANGLTSVNPALSSIWKLNTSVRVNVQVSDLDNNGVCANAYLYYDTEYQQNESFVCGNPDTVFSFYFTANHTGNNYVLRMVGYDDYNPTEQHIKEFYFSVGLNGIEFGDAETIFDFEAPDGSGISINDTDGIPSNYTLNPESQDLISDGLMLISQGTGLGMTITYLLLMLFIAGGIWVFSMRERIEPKLTFGIIIICEILLLIIGTMLRVLNPAILISIIVLGIALIVLYIMYLIKGNE